VNYSVQDIFDVNTSEVPAEDPARFYKLRDELWWKVRQRFEKREICIPNDDELIGELTVIKYEPEGGKIGEGTSPFRGTRVRRSVCLRAARMISQRAGARTRRNAATAAAAVTVDVLAGKYQAMVAIPAHATHHEVALQPILVLRKTSMVTRSASKPASDAS